MWTLPEDGDKTENGHDANRMKKYIELTNIIVLIANDQLRYILGESAT